MNIRLGDGKHPDTVTLVPLTPVVMTIFAGSLDLIKLSWFQKWITEKVKSPVGDFRDWIAIAAWALELPAKMGICGFDHYPVPCSP